MSLTPKRSRATPQINHTTFTISLHAKANILSTLWKPLNVRHNMLGNENGLLTSDLTRIDAKPAIRHFSETGHNFEHYAKFTIIEQIKNLNLKLSLSLSL